jgi:hypothetical protein
MADAVLALVAVVAEFDTFPAVEIVASFVSTIAAEAFMSALTIVPSAILPEVIVPSSTVNWEESTHEKPSKN